MFESRAGVCVVNEDRYICDPGLGLYAVLDGEVHRGHGAEIAAEALHCSWRDSDRPESPYRSEPASHSLVESVRAANRAVFAAGSQARWRGCGTTLTCCALSGGTVVIAHVGDSRLYHRRADVWRLVTRDHSLVEDTRRAHPDADMTELIRDHSTVITRGLGFTPEVVVDTFVVDALPGDSILLCTDGAWRPFDPALSGILPPLCEPKELSRWIFDRYTRDGERDNATLLWLGL